MANGTYAALSTADKKSLDDFMVLLRPLAIEHQKVLNVAAAIASQYNLNVFAILNNLAQTEVVLDSTGLAGAVQMTVADIMAMSIDIMNLITEDVAGRSVRRTKACGANNMIGGI